MFTARTSKRSGPLIDMLDRVFTAAGSYIEQKLDSQSRQSAARALKISPETSWPDIHCFAKGRVAPEIIRKRMP